MMTPPGLSPNLKTIAPWLMFTDTNINKKSYSTKNDASARFVSEFKNNSTLTDVYRHKYKQKKLLNQEWCLRQVCLRI